MIEELRRIRNQRPFAPYSILLTDGRRFHITDQFHVALAKSYVVVYDAPKDRFIDVSNASIDQITVDEIASETVR